MEIELLITIGIYLFILTSMLFIGLGHTYRDFLEPFKNIKLVLFALLVNLVLIPVAGYLVATVFALSGAMLVGFLLMTSAPGASYGPRLAEVSGGDVPFATGLMFLLCTVALVSTPITLLLLMPEDSVISMWPVIRTLLLLMVVPMAAGLIVRAKRPAIAKKTGGTCCMGFVYHDPGCNGPVSHNHAILAKCRRRAYETVWDIWNCCNGNCRWHITYSRILMWWANDRDPKVACHRFCYQERRDGHAFCYQYIRWGCERGPPRSYCLHYRPDRDGRTCRWEVEKTICPWGGIA